MEKTLTCIVCPKGCTINIAINNKQTSVAGNACPKGKEYAICECTNPTRTVTATVRVSNRENTMVSVKTSVPIPKGQMMDVMRILRSISVPAPLSVGESILENVCGASILVTKAVDS